MKLTQEQRQEIIENLEEIFSSEYLADLTDEELKELYDNRYLHDDMVNNDITFEIEQHAGYRPGY